jgi:hypothetical protein
MLGNELFWIPDDDPEETFDDLLVSDADLDEQYIMDYDTNFKL